MQSPEKCKALPWRRLVVDQCVPHTFRIHSVKDERYITPRELETHRESSDAPLYFAFPIRERIVLKEAVMACSRCFRPRDKSARVTVVLSGRRDPIEK